MKTLNDESLEDFCRTTVYIVYSVRSSEAG